MYYEYEEEQFPLPDIVISRTMITSPEGDTDWMPLFVVEESSVGRIPAGSIVPAEDVWGMNYAMTQDVYMQVCGVYTKIKNGVDMYRIDRRS